MVSTLSALNPEPKEPQRCAAQLGGTAWHLSPDQAQNAGLFAAMAAERELPPRAVTIAIATALQESRLSNIDYGDRDSIGLFQQRPSQGWGSVDQIMEPVYATGKFYDGLSKVSDYQSMEITVAAQAVQRSGFPDAYAQHESRSRAWASALSGHQPGAITCVLHDAARTPSLKKPSKGLTTRVQRDFPSLTPIAVKHDAENGPGVQIDAANLPGTNSTAERQRSAVGLAHWAVTVALEQDIVSVQVADLTWFRATGTWQPASAPAKPGIVVIRLAPVE